MLLAASQYKLTDLLTTCEHLLTPMVDVSNCVELFVRAEEASAETLRKFCASLMSSHWVIEYFFFHLTFFRYLIIINFYVFQEDLNRENLAPLSAQSLYRLLEEHSSHPLHAAVRLGREDVVFLDLIKYTQQVRLKNIDFLNSILIN